MKSHEIFLSRILQRKVRVLLGDAQHGLSARVGAASDKQQVMYLNATVDGNEYGCLGYALCPAANFSDPRRDEGIRMFRRGQRIFGPKVEVYVCFV